MTAPRVPEQPLTEQDRQEIDRALEQLEQARDLIDKAKRAGIDVTEFEQRGREARDRLMRLKQVFFPGQ